MQRGEPFHGERIVDGDASTLTALLLYKAGSTTAFTLASNERLSITRVTIMNETGGDTALLADSAAAGKYIFEGSLFAQGGIDKDYSDFPYVCTKGVTPKFKGATTNKSTCIVEGFVTRT